MIDITPFLSLEAIKLADQKRLMQLMKCIYPPAYAHYWKDDCSWYLNEQYGIENLKNELKEKDSFYYLVHFRESVVGILRLQKHYNYPPIPEHIGFKVHRLYLDTATQGKGVGRTLMNYAAKTAIESDHDLIWLDAMDTHGQAQGFYKSLGYERTQSQRLPFKHLHDEHRQMWYLHKML